MYRVWQGSLPYAQLVREMGASTYYYKHILLNLYNKALDTNLS